MTPDEAINELTGSEHGWSRQTLDVWRRAGFRCEYCGTDLLKTSDAYFRGGHLDHIVPGGGDHFENLALACAPCNYIKRGTNPGADTLSRKDQIEAAKRIILVRREVAERRLANAMPYLRVLIEADRPEADGAGSIFPEADR